jgi:hypothetical protein
MTATTTTSKTSCSILKKTGTAGWGTSMKHEFLRKTFARSAVKTGCRKVEVAPANYVYQPTQRMDNFEEAVRMLREAHRTAQIAVGGVANTTEEVVANVRRSLEKQGVCLTVMDIDVAGYEQYVAQAGYRHAYSQYYSDNWQEKSLEHYVTYQMSNITKADILVDIASEQSPFPEIMHKLTACTGYRQDIMYPPGIQGRQIGGDACHMPVPDVFFSKAALTCSLEHFEGDADIRLFAELSRVLQTNGAVCIAPLYLHEFDANQTDPTISVPNHVVFDELARLYAAQNWGNRFARFYSPETLLKRIIEPYKTLFAFAVFLFANASQIGPNIYLRWGLRATKR